MDSCEYDSRNPTGYTNGNGELNWCVSDLGQFTCTPGCDIVPGVCRFYPGTTCRSVTDIDTTAVSVCLP
jgi:hypothetical protein